MPSTAASRDSSRRSHSVVAAFSFSRAACVGCVLAPDFSCIIVCGDVFSSASDALFSVMYFSMTMFFCLFPLFFFSFLSLLSTSCHRDHLKKKRHFAIVSLLQ